MPDPMQTLSLLLLAALAGASFVSQSAVNAQLRQGLGSPAWAAFFSYLGGTVVMALVLLAMRAAIPSAAAVSRAPWYAWAGGLFGAIYVVSLVVLLPRLGSATAIAALVAGQMIASLVFDQFGVLGLKQHPIDLPRAAGAMLLIVGVVLIRR